MMTIIVLLMEPASKNIVGATAGSGRGVRFGSTLSSLLPSASLLPRTDHFSVRNVLPVGREGFGIGVDTERIRFRLLCVRAGSSKWTGSQSRMSPIVA